MATKIEAAPCHMVEDGIEQVWRDARLNRIGAGTEEIMPDVIGRSYGR